MYTHDVAQKGYEDQRQITRAVRSEILKSMVIPISKILNVTFQGRMLYQPLSKIHFSWQTNSMNFMQM